MPRPDPDAYWPLLRFLDDEETPEEDRLNDDPGCETIMLRDRELLALKVLLRYSCQRLLAGVLEGERESRLIGFADALDSLRLKVESVLDLEFKEGQFSEEPSLEELDG